jgi:long-chain acyl-CoA synthetase
MGDEKVRAVLVVRAPCESGEIVEFCRGRLADFKVPSIVEFRDELPKSATGKILRTTL